MRVTGLNIAVVGPFPADPEKVVGGVEAVNATLAPALAAQDDVARVTVLSFGRGQSGIHKRRLSDKLEIWYLPGQRRPMMTRAWLEKMHARRAIAEIKPDIVHAHGIGVPGDIATSLGLPAVVTVHGLEHVEARLGGGGGLGKRARIALVDATVKSVLRRARVVISISNYDAAELDQLVQGQRVSIPNPVAPAFFADPNYEGDGNRLLFAGVMKRRKNVEGLLRAFASARTTATDARLTIIGPAPDQTYADEIHALVNTLDLGNVVEFLGHVENDRLIQEMRACRAVALFSHEETSPTILAQAMAMGKPVVSSRVGGVAEMISDGENGFLVTPADETTFADRLAQLLGSPELSQQMGRRGRQIALRRCEPNAVARQTLDAYALALQPAAQPIGALQPTPDKR